MHPSAFRLLALDIDGTLVSDDDTIAEVDRQAVAEAQRRGLAVTLATGRLVPRTLPVASALGLTLPLVCADGAAEVCPRTHQITLRGALTTRAMSPLLAAAKQFALHPVVFTPEAILGPRTACALPFLAGWTPRVVPCEDLNLRVTAAPAGIVNALVFGQEAAVRAAAATLGAIEEAGADLAVFPIEGSGFWAARLAPRGITKATGLQTVIDDLGLAAREVAVVGDWYNDLSMFGWAGRSYAMAQAPEAVAGAATIVLSCDARRGGGVAEAVHHLLQPPTSAS